MKCPVCKTTDLLMTERRSIEIDYCPVCRGIWLDRGELDKLIAQEAGSDDVQANATHARAATAIRIETEIGNRHRDHAYDNNRTYDNQPDGLSGTQEEALAFRHVRFRLNGVREYGTRQQLSNQRRALLSAAPFHFPLRRCLSQRRTLHTNNNVPCVIDRAKWRVKPLTV